MSSRECKVIICDTREHEPHRSRVIRQIEKCGYKVEVRKLDTGDYCLVGKENTVIDRKHNLDEVLTNLCSKDSSRFWREIRRSREHGIKLIFLVEHGGGVSKLTDVAAWKSDYSRVTGRQLMERMYRAAIGWNVEWIFCDRRHTGKEIVRLLEEASNGNDDGE